jgi:hypothetical protein
MIKESRKSKAEVADGAKITEEPESEQAIRVEAIPF